MVGQFLVFDLEELGHVAEFGVAGVEQFFDGILFQFGEMLMQGGVKEQSGGFVVDVGSALGLGDDAVNAAEFFEVFGGNAHGLGGEFFFGGIAPHDGRATLGRDHGVNGVFHHQDTVGDGNRQRASASALARN